MVLCCAYLFFSLFKISHRLKENEVYSKIQDTLNNLCGSGFQTRIEMIAVENRSHNQYHLRFSENRLKNNHCSHEAETWFRKTESNSHPKIQCFAILVC